MNKYTDQVPDEPTASEKTWFTYAVTSAALTLSFVILAAIYVFSADPQAAAMRIQILAPFGTALLALVTFTTVVWRGLVNTRQANEQRRQNDTKDLENLAKLLIDGTELVLDESNRPASVRAGIAALQVVACSSDNRFAAGAMDVLVDVIKNTATDASKADIFDTARHAIEAAYLSGRKVDYITTLRAPEGEEMVWKNVRALPCHFVGGIVDRGFLNGSHLIEREEIQYKSFENVVFREVNLNNDFLIGCENCKFIGCNVTILTDYILIHNKFFQCNFSNAIFSENMSILGVGTSFWLLVEDMIKEGENFYYIENYPGTHREINWEYCLYGRDSRRRRTYSSDFRPEFDADIPPKERPT